MSKQWVIPGNVPSSKNSKRWTGRFFINSKVVERYIKETALFWASYAADFRRATEGLPKPLHIQMEFHRDSRRRFDYINPGQTVQDLMVKNGWIDDDNADEIVPSFKPYVYDPASTGVRITLLAKQP